MTITEVRQEYAWERKAFGDLEIGLDFRMAEQWVRILRIELGLTRHHLSFAYHERRHDRLLGEVTAGESLDHEGKWHRGARVQLFAPHGLRTLGHEFTHAARWILHEKAGHGDGWRKDLTRTHEIIRKHRPRLHWCEFDQGYKEFMMRKMRI